MKTLGNIGLVALLSVAGSLSLGCSAQEGDSETDEGAAVIGAPTPPVMGTFEWSSTGKVLKFKRDKDAQGQAIAAVEYQRNGIGEDPMAIKDPSGREFGPAMNKTAEQAYGWFTNTKWKCKAAEMFVFNEERTQDPNQDCYVEINPAGGQNFSAVVVGLDANGKGLSSWSGSSGVKPAAVNGGAVHPVTAGPPRQVNLTIDAPAVLAAMKAANSHFAVPTTTRNDCLKNALAGGWLDIQAHYYCLLPYESVRTCYSTKLVEVAKAVASTPPPPPPAQPQSPPVEAYKACLAPPAAGTADTRTAQAKWVHENQEGVFKYIMFTKQGLFDFNLESENAPINDFYRSLNAPRPRRVLDTYPEWLPDQPRYEVIRKAQVKAQAAAAAAAGGATQ